MIVTAADAYLIPFSLVWCGFAIFWEITASASVMAAGASAAASVSLRFFPLFGALFVGVGLYFVAGRFAVDAWIRRRIRYAITDRRVLILRTGPFSSFTALALNRLPDIKLSEGRNAGAFASVSRRTQIDYAHKMQIGGGDQFACVNIRRAAFRALRDQGGPKLLEPVMKIEVLTPDTYLGAVVGDLNARRGRIQSVEQWGSAQRVTAFAPLAQMFGYADALKTLSQGLAQFLMVYDHYEPVP